MNLALFVTTAAAAAALSAAPAPDRQACADRITQVREATGQPRLQRETADPGKPLLIAAVDKRIDGCRVLVMAADPRDVRPEPEVESRRAGLLPATDGNLL
jgi:hypothetical protein